MYTRHLAHLKCAVGRKIKYLLQIKLLIQAAKLVPGQRLDVLHVSSTYVILYNIYHYAYCYAKCIKGLRSLLDGDAFVQSCAR